MFDPRFFDPDHSTGTLARMPLSGAAPRAVLDGVQEADFGPDGERLAAVRKVSGRFRIEDPIGVVRYESEGWISRARRRTRTTRGEAAPLVAGSLGSGGARVGRDDGALGGRPLVRVQLLRGALAPLPRRGPLAIKPVASAPRIPRASPAGERGRGRRRRRARPTRSTRRSTRAKVLRFPTRRHDGRSRRHRARDPPVRTLL